MEFVLAGSDAGQQFWQQSHAWLAEPFRICSDKFPSLSWWSHVWSRIGT